MLRTLSLLAAGAVLFVAGCRTTRPPDLEAELPDAFPYHTVEQIRLNLSDGSDSLQTFKAKGTLAVQTPELSGSFGASMTARRSDSLYLRLTATLGIEAARALLTTDSAFVYIPIKKRLLYGALADASDQLPSSFTSADVFPDLLGLLVPEPGVAWKLDADSAFYYLRDPDRPRFYQIDPAFWRVVRYEERTADGDLVEERVYSDFDKIAGVILPRRARFRRPQDQSAASLYYREMTLNPSDPSFSFNVSDNADRRRFGD